MSGKVRLGKTEMMADRNGFGALPIQRISEEEACRLAEDKSECIEYEQIYAESGQLVNEGWTCVNVDSSIIDEIK